MKYIAAAILIILILIICEIIFETHSFCTRHYEIHTGRDEMSGKKRVIFLSDLHNCVYGLENQKLMNAIREQKPGMILIGGDMLVGKRGVRSEEAKKFVRSVRSICPVYYALGNHEQRMREMPEYYGTYFQEYKKGLEEAGVCFLENTKADFEWNGMPVTVSGFELPAEYYKRGNRKLVSVQEMESCIGRSNPNRYQIVLAHNPVHMETYWKWGADLVLSGHLHGGIVRIPGFRGVITPQFGLFPKYSGGKYIEEQKSCVVSTGIGTHSIPVRLFNRAELIVLDLEK